MKKRLLSLFLVLAVVFSFSLSVFATDTGIDIIDDPLSYYLENQVLGVYKGTGVTLVCPKWDYKDVYTGGTLVTCPYDGEALVLSDLAGVHAEKVPSGIGRKDLPGYEDDEGTAQVSKEGVLTYVAHPRWFISDGGKKYSTVPYQDFYEHQIWDDEKCVAGSGHTSSCIDSEFYFTYTSGGYDFKSINNFKPKQSSRLSMAWDIADGKPAPGIYYVAANQPYGRYRKSLGADETIRYTSSRTIALPLSDGYTNYGISLYMPFSTTVMCYNADSISRTLTAHFYPFIVTCSPTENTITPKDTVTIGDNTFTGKIYEDSNTDLTYIYPECSTTGDDGDTITVVPDHPLIYNSGSDTYYIYDNSTKNYYYLDYTPQVTPTPSPTPSPTPVVTPTPSSEPVVTPTPTPVVTPTPSPEVTPTPTPDAGNNDHCDHTGIIAVLEQIRDKMVAGFTDITANIHADMVDFKAAVVAGFTDITTNITAVVADFKAAVVAGFADLSANFQLAIENLNINIQNFFNKKMEDLPEPTPAPSPTPEPSAPTPSPAPTEPPAPILPETQNLIIPKMNSNTFTDEHGTWIASGSSKYSDVFDFFHAFDRSTSDFWETNASPSYLQIEIPDPKNYYVDGYIMRISKFTNRYAKEWTLQGSDDGKTWDDLDTQKGQNLSDLEEHKYPLTLRKAYKYYRLNMSNYASSMCSLSHFNLLGYDAKDIVTPTPAPTNPPSPSPAPDPGTDPTPVPTPGGDSGGNNSSSGDSSLNPFKWLTDLLKNIVEGILKAIWKLITALFGFLLWLLSLVGSLFPFIPGQAVLAVTSAVVIVAVIRIIKFITGR